MTHTINLDADLRAAHFRFAERTKGLSPRVLRLQLLALVSKPDGLGFGQVDPLERSFAQQSLDILDAKDGIERLEKAHADLSSRRDTRLAEGERLVQLQELELEQNKLKVRVIDAAKRTHAGAAELARDAYAARNAESAKIAAIREAAETRANAIILETDPLVANLANALVEGRRAI